MSYIFVDIETIPHSCASEFVDAPDLAAIAAAKNLKDPAKIAEDIQKRQAEAQADYERSLSRASLDFNLNKIVAIGWAHETNTPTVVACQTEADEMKALDIFWRGTTHGQIAGFATRTFDVPTLIQRSRLLGVKYPHVSLARYGRGDVIDLRDILTFDDARYEAIMPRTLRAFCKRFGIPVDDTVKGEDIAQLVSEGNWSAVVEHCRSDVKLTQALAAKVLPRLHVPVDHQRTGEAVL